MKLNFPLTINTIKVPWMFYALISRLTLISFTAILKIADYFT